MTQTEIKFHRAQAWTAMLVAGEQAKANPTPFNKERHEAAWHTWERLDKALDRAA